MTTAQSLVLGIVQGLTEFLPVSSTAHLRILPYFLGWEDPGAGFSAAIQLGTLAAVFIYFAGDIKRLTAAAWEGLRLRDLRRSYLERQGILHGEYFYHDYCQPVVTEQLINETSDYIGEAERLASYPS